MMKLLRHPKFVAFEAMAGAIERFNAAGRNPFGPILRPRGHAPLLLRLEGPGIDVEFELRPCDRLAGSVAFLRDNPGFLTRHPVLYPMTPAVVRQQWHRVYAYAVGQAEVVDVRLLATNRQDPALVRQHTGVSADPWLLTARQVMEPISFAG